MCGRMRLDTDWSEVVDAFDLELEAPPATFGPKYNIAPTQPVLVVTGPLGARNARDMIWGFVPWWERSAKPKQRPINAKCEGIATSGMFKHAFAERRCLVPVTGFYEWLDEPDGKQPILFARPDFRPYALAGIWGRWKPEGGEPVETFCVLTTTPNAVTRSVHDRMPVVLADRAAMARWTDPGATPDDLAALMVPADDALLIGRRVNRAMNAPQRDTRDDAAFL